MKQALGKIFHSNSIGSPSVLKILCKNWTVEIPQVGFSIVDSLLNVPASSPSMRRNLSRRVLLLLTT